MKRHKALLTACALLLIALGGLPRAAPLFAWLFPGLDRPLYQQDSFLSLTLAHLGIVLAASVLMLLLGVGSGLLVSRPRWRELRPLLETLLAISQAFPPVAVLAVAAPLVGFGDLPALIALALYGILPVTQGTLNGMDSVPAHLVDVARGMGMTPRQILLKVEWPLAMPVILSGIRTAVVINIGTAAIASTVGAKTLGLPIIVGLSGFNTAYVLQGALLVALLAVCADLGFEWLAGHLAIPAGTR